MTDDTATNTTQNAQGDEKNLTAEEQEARKEQKRLEKEKKKQEAKEREKLKKQEKKAAAAATATAGDAAGASAGKVVKKNVDKMGIEQAKEEDLGEWYQQVISKSEMIDYYDVSGCYILRPWSYLMWENIRDYIDTRIKKLGVQNSYFPLFVTKSRLETEKDHVEGFAPEVAWVTKSGGSDLAEPIAIRPTSETIMYPAFSQWIRSHRDLPLKLNQWSNVVRWEFKNPVPFIRSREFLWQEGHTAFATRDEAVEEVYQILDIYRSTYEDLLAVPVTKGRKTEVEKFAGGDFTTTVEAFIGANGRSVQAATSHCLGQNFSRMFKIEFENENLEKSLVWQNSWGFTTRSIGVMVMVHGDNKGLVLPPRVAPTQAVIIPVVVKDESVNAQTLAKADELADILRRQGNMRVLVDKSTNKSPGWKYNHYELKGVPVRIELGPRDVEKQQIVAAKRNTGEKLTLPWTSAEQIVQEVQKVLDTIHDEMLAAAKKVRADHTDKITTWAEFVPSLDKKNVVLVPFCETKACEEQVKKRSGEEAKKLGGTESGYTGAAKSLCIPLEQPELPAGSKCFCCGAEAKSWTLFGRSY